MITVYSNLVNNISVPLVYYCKVKLLADKAKNDKVYIDNQENILFCQII